MIHVRWRLRSLLLLIAGLAVLCAGAMKWRRYAELQKQIATYAREEKLLMAEYEESLRFGSPLWK
jgi:hypothetical protein